jgi:RNA polymerase sigma factor (sigma-70 family)
MPDLATHAATGQISHIRLMQAVGEKADREAFATLFGHFAPRIKGYLLRLGASAPAAEELAQEVMLTVWRRAASYDPAQANVSTWIFTIARNKRIDALRKENRPAPDLNDPALVKDPPEQADRLVSKAAEARQLREAIADLPEEQAELVRMAFFRDETHSEIAASTGLPIGTVKSRLRAALIKLGRALERDA